MYVGHCDCLSEPETNGDSWRYRIALDPASTISSIELKLYDILHCHYTLHRLPDHERHASFSLSPTFAYRLASYIGSIYSAGYFTTCKNSVPIGFAKQRCQPVDAMSVDTQNVVEMSSNRYFFNTVSDQKSPINELPRACLSAVAAASCVLTLLTFFIPHPFFRPLLLRDGS